MRRIILAVAALWLLAVLPAQAHTDAELAVWLSDWQDRADTLTVDLIGEWRDMAARHPCRITLCQPQNAPPAARIRPPGDVVGVEQWRPLVEAYWPAELVGWALKIMACESGGDPWADNPRSTARGLFQFLRSTWDRGPAPALGLPSYDSGAPYNPEWNIMAAAWLYQNWGGESQWSCKA